MAQRTQRNTFAILLSKGFPGGSDGKVSACNVGYLGLILGLGRSPEEGNGNSLQYSFLEIPMDGGAWEATVHRITKSQTRLNNFTFTFPPIYGHCGWKMSEGFPVSSDKGYA